MTIQALLYSELDRINEDETETAKETTCRNRLNNINNNVAASYLFDDDVYGNHEGHVLLEDMARMRDQVGSLMQSLKAERQTRKKEIRSLEEESQTQKKEIRSLWEEIRWLKTQLGAMSLDIRDGQIEAETIAMRNRFFYNFANKILGWTLDKAMTQGGNKVAYEGNIGLDLALLQKRPPDDQNLLLIFEKLYGLNYDQALQITGQCIS